MNVSRNVLTESVDCLWWVECFVEWLVRLVTGLKWSDKQLVRYYVKSFMLVFMRVFF